MKTNVQIPCVIITVLGYGSYYFVLRNRLSFTQQVWYHFTLVMIWISYLLAIHADPGSPVPKFTPKQGEWRRWCKKCKNYKPERSHHCKVCNKCILTMDHHCPWTYSCVGYNNRGHFMRFLFWVLIDSGAVMYVLLKKGIELYHDRDLPSYLIDKWELVAVIVLLPLDMLMFFSIMVLYVRCIINWVFKGMTQIEVWEYERIDNQFFTERLWLHIQRNYQQLYGKQLPNLTSWNRNSQFYELDRRQQHNNDNIESSVVPVDYTIDDMIFPYDLGIWGNLILTFNYPWLWLWPWTRPPLSGMYPTKSEFIEDDQLGLPWPPDGGHQEFSPDDDVDLNQLSSHELRDLSKLRKRLDPRNKLSRNEWMNDLGETLDDYGVDMDAEDDNDLLETDRPSQLKLIKVCGIKHVNMAQVAVNNSSDLVGMIILRGVRRSIDFNEAKALTQMIRDIRVDKHRQFQTIAEILKFIDTLNFTSVDALLKKVTELIIDNGPFSVGVFRNQSKEEVFTLGEDLGLDIIQLHGKEDKMEYCHYNDVNCARKYGIIPRFVIPDEIDSIYSILNELLVDGKYKGNGFLIPLLDGDMGGEGKCIDWDVVKQLKPGKFLLAGGLTDVNIKHLTGIDNVIGFDVSGGVETDGEKDTMKIERFIKTGKSIQ